MFKKKSCKLYLTLTVIVISIVTIQSCVHLFAVAYCMYIVGHFLSKFNFENVCLVLNVLTADFFQKLTFLGDFIREKLNSTLDRFFSYIFEFYSPSLNFT